MRRHILFLIAMLLCFSCSDNDKEKSSVDPVSEAKSTPFIGSVILNWNNPANENFYYTLISYKNGDGETINKKVDAYSLNEEKQSETIVGGFYDTNEYEFTLTCFNYDGASSSPVIIKGTPRSREDAKDYVISTIKLEPSSSGASLSWTNETGVGVNLIATYLNRKNESVTMTVDASSTGVKGLTGFIATTEINIYAENVEGGAKSEVKTFNITPIIDPDDIIYDDVDYITFAGGVNTLDVFQENPENPYEYRFLTQGGDPFINAVGMKHSITGPTLVFRYKSTADIDLELFWCNAGGGAAGGRSTVVKVPANNTEDWTTFTYDYSSDMTKHNWAGNAGDFFRFDVGNKKNVTLWIKNVHFK